MDQDVNSIPNISVHDFQLEVVEQQQAAGYRGTISTSVDVELTNGSEKQQRPRPTWQ